MLMALERLYKARNKYGNHSSSSSVTATPIPSPSMDDRQPESPFYSRTQTDTASIDTASTKAKKNQLQQLASSTRDGLYYAGAAFSKTSKIVFKNVISTISNVPVAGPLMRNERDARLIAKYIFENLCSPGKFELTLQDFLPYFDDDDDAKHAFSLFDKDGNGDISRIEMRSVVLEYYRERKALEKSLRDSSQAISKLDGFLKIFVFIVLLFIILGIYNVNVASFVTALASLWLGLSFALGGTIKNLVESIIFLFFA